MEVGGAIFVDGSAFHTKFGACRRAGWAAVQVDLAGRFVACMYGVVPRGWGPDQWARDGEDYAFHMLARFSEPPSDGDDGVPLEVFSDCAGSIACATSSSTALDPRNERRHLWQLWWSRVGSSARVEKVKAHRALKEATSWEDEWKLRGNRLADEWAKKGAALWAMDEEQELLQKAASG